LNTVDFVSDSEVMPLLREMGITPEPAEENMVRLRMMEDPSVARYAIRMRGRTIETTGGGPTDIELSEEDLIPTLLRVMHRLHLDQIIIIPVGKWANVLDAVAFAMAEDEQWLEFDAAATVERNTRDPLLCLPADVHLLDTLISALITDADQADQGLVLTSVASPVIFEIVPGVGAEVTIGAPALADEVTSVLRQYGIPDHH